MIINCPTCLTSTNLYKEFKKNGDWYVKCYECNWVSDTYPHHIECENESVHFDKLLKRDIPDWYKLIRKE